MAFNLSFTTTVQLFNRQLSSKSGIFYYLRHEGVLSINHSFSLAQLLIKLVLCLLDSLLIQSLSVLWMHNCLIRLLILIDLSFYVIFPLDGPLDIAFGKGSLELGSCRWFSRTDLRLVGERTYVGVVWKNCGWRSDLVLVLSFSSILHLL